VRLFAWPYNPKSPRSYMPCWWGTKPPTRTYDSIY